MNWIAKQLRRLAAIAAILSCGCNGLQPIVNPTPQPVSPSEPQKVIVEVKVSDGKLTVNDATINVAQTTTAGELCPCCGATGVCQGTCGKAGCVCPVGTNSAASTAGKVSDLPQFKTQYVRQQVCDPVNGCRIVTVPVQVPVASQGTTSLRNSQRPIGSGQVTIYDNGSPAGKAMRDAIGSKGFDWRRSDPPVAINGVRWSPTAVKPDGSAWTPGADGWHAQSAAQFQAWLATP